MKPIKFDEANVNYAPPAYVKNCGDLPVFKIDNECISCWKMSWRERLSALIHGKVWLEVMGGQPPVAMRVQDDIFMPTVAGE